MEHLIETKRLYLRKLTSADDNEFFDLNADVDVIQYTGDESFISVEKAREFLTKYQTDHKNSEFGRWAMINKDDQAFVGWCGLKFNSISGETDLGFRLHKKYWNQGLATEASLACLKYAKETLGLKRIIANAMDGNSASIRILEKCGFDYLMDKEENGKKWLIFEIYLPF